MDRPLQEALYAQLHAALVGHMAALTRLSFMMTGASIDPMQLVEAMEADLKRESARIGNELSQYSSADLKARKKIAEQVVGDIRRAVQGRA